LIIIFEIFCGVGVGVGFGLSARHFAGFKEKCIYFHEKSAIYPRYVWICLNMSTYVSFYISLYPLSYTSSHRIPISGTTYHIESQILNNCSKNIHFIYLYAHIIHVVTSDPDKWNKNLNLSQECSHPGYYHYNSDLFSFESQSKHTIDSWEQLRLELLH
jgi:hypothetical protein